MKKFIRNTWLQVLGLIAAFILAAGQFAYGQDYKRVGNKFIQTTTARDTMITDYTLVSGGKEYQIIINKGTGTCYIWKTSSKSGKLYKQYLKKELSQEIAKELSIVYKGKK